jgi:hypothetical protein
VPRSKRPVCGSMGCRSCTRGEIGGRRSRRERLRKASVQAIAGGGSDVPAMPPKGDRVTSAEVSLIRAWIDQGTHGATPETKTRPATPASDHWAFQPVVRPPLPTVRDVSWVRNPSVTMCSARTNSRGRRSREASLAQGRRPFRTRAKLSPWNLCKRANLAFAEIAVPLDWRANLVWCPRSPEPTRPRKWHSSARDRHVGRTWQKPTAVVI